MLFVFRGISMQKNPKQSDKRYIAIVLFGMFFFGSGMVLLIISIILFVVIFPSTYWPSVSGVVTSSRFMERGGAVTGSDTRHYVRVIPKPLKNTG